MHFAVHGHTAAKLIAERADAEKEHMGLTTWENGPLDDKPPHSSSKYYMESLHISRILI